MFMEVNGVVAEDQNLNGGVLIDEKENIVNSAGIVVSREPGCYRLSGSSASTCPGTGASTCPSASTCSSPGTDNA